MGDRARFDALLDGVAVASDDEIAAYEARMQREVWRQNLVASGIDALRDEDRKLILTDKLAASTALTKVRQWLGAAMRTAVDPGVNTLVICGGMGTGKTVAAGWAISRHGGVYATVETYLRDYDRWLRDRSHDDKSSPTIWRYKRAQLVVLDELGTETDAALMQRAFERLIDSRQSRRRELTLILSNLSRAEVVTRVRGGAYGMRTYDRMKRDARIIEVSGESMRQGTW